jgi:hypothetical protein
MGRSRVVQPEVVRLALSDGDFIDVKRDLNAGEYFDLLTALADRQKFAKILAYVVGWSLVGLDDQPLPYDADDPAPTRRDTIGALDKATLRELIATIDRHEAAQDVELAKKKTAPSSGGSASKAISTSAG